MVLAVVLERITSFFGANPKKGRAPARTPLRSRPRLEPLEERYSPSLVSDFAVLDAFGVLGLSGSKISITNPATEVGGSVGLCPHGIQNFADGIIDGKF